MRRPELDYILSAMLDSQPEVSDLLFTVDKPLQVESFGELKPVTLETNIEKLTPFQTEMVALNLVGDNQWHLIDLLRRGSCDTAYTLSDKARFRINIFSQRGNYSIVLRKLNTVIPTLDSLKSSAGQLVPTMTSLITFGQLFDRAAPGDYLNVDATIEFLLDAPAQRPPLPANSSANKQSSTNSYAQASTNSGSVSQLLTGGLR